MIGSAARPKRRGGAVRRVALEVDAAGPGEGPPSYRPGVPGAVEGVRASAAAVASPLDGRSAEGRSATPRGRPPTTRPVRSDEGATGRRACAANRLTRAAALFAAIALLAGPPAAAQPAAEWAAAAGPTPGPARAIGSASLGCLAGAVALPPEGPGWQAVRLSRNRHWGHPDLVRFVETLAASARARGFPDLWIGDLAQPRGGPMPWGHASHQTGLDVDIWLDLSPKPAGGPATRGARESIEVPSLVLPGETGVDPARWTRRHAELLRLAAEHPGVDRVLVNHAIKRHLCRTHAGEPWLRRVRPWRGHDSHAHIRVACPAGAAECVPAPPIPAGDGCDASLDWWLTEEARRPAPRPPGPAPRLPAACAAVLRGG